MAKLRLKLIRTNVHDKQNYTTGVLFNMNNNRFVCNTLEDKVRDFNADGDLLDDGEKKVYGKTAIPYGTYDGFLRFSPSRQRIVPQLKDVPHFKYIQIHSGNDIEDTLGCILVGFKRDGDKIYQSRDAESALVSLIQAHGGTFEIEIV